MSTAMPYGMAFFINTCIFRARSCRIASGAQAETAAYEWMHQCICRGGENAADGDLRGTTHPSRICKKAHRGNLPDALTIFELTLRVSDPK